MTLRLRTDDLEWREIDNEIVLLDGRQATYLSTNGCWDPPLASARRRRDS